MENLNNLNNLNIAYDAKRVFCNRTGLGNYGRTLLNNFYRFYPEHKLSLYSPKQTLPFFEEEIAAGKIQLHTPQNSLMRALHPLWRSFYLSHKLHQDAKKEKIQIYHGLSHELPFGIEDYPEIKTVVTIHDLIYLRYPEFFPMVDRFVYDVKFRYACEHATKIIAICQQTARDIEEFFDIDPSKIQVIYQSIDEQFYEKASAQIKNQIRKKYQLPEDYLLYTGTLEERKNAKAIIEALHILKDRVSIPLVIVGDGNTKYKKELKKMVTDLKLENQVLFLGRVDFKELPALYQMAKVFVFPSFFEGFGLPIVEAIASGIPVITSQGSCFPEAAGTGGLYIDPKDPEHLAFAIEKLLTDEVLYQQLVECGAEHIKTFESSRTSEELQQLYANL